jgi:hypothetical protein
MSRIPADARVSSRRGGAGPSSWTLLTRVSRRVFLVGVVGVALVGALFGSALATFLVAPAVGLFGACQTAVLHPDFPARPSARRAVVMSGLGWALTVPYAMGVAALGVVGAMLTVALVLIGALVLMGALGDGCRDDATPSSPGADATLLSELVRGLPTSTLLEEWQSSEAVLDDTTDPESRAAAIQLRALLLEEMSRRDPAGVARWLQEGAGGLPDRHIGGDSGPAPA